MLSCFSLTLLSASCWWIASVPAADRDRCDAPSSQFNGRTEGSLLTMLKVKRHKSSCPITAQALESVCGRRRGDLWRLLIGLLSPGCKRWWFGHTLFLTGSLMHKQLTHIGMSALTITARHALKLTSSFSRL